MEHYFIQDPKSESKENKIEIKIFDKKLEFYTNSGVFSKTKLDDRSELLIKNCIIQPNWKILDYGCGWGPIGIILLKKYNINCTFIDTNQRAIELTKKNIELNNIKNKFQILKCDIEDNTINNNKIKFDSILLNPPLKSGLKNCKRMFLNAYNNLKLNGILQIVYRNKVEGNEFEKYINKIFGNFNVITQKSIIKVTICRKLE